MIDAFLSKDGALGGLIETYAASRGELVATMWDNVRGDPWRGIGFGIASAPDFMWVERNGAYGLPVSAAVEKGLLPLAILEEVGMLGLLAVAAWVWMLVRRSAVHGIPPLAVCLTVLAMNLSESMLFSPGGMGLLCMILVGWGASAAHPRRRAGVDHGGSVRASTVLRIRTARAAGHSRAVRPASAPSAPIRSRLADSQ